MEEVPVYVTKFQTDFKILAYLITAMWGLRLLDGIILGGKLNKNMSLAPQQPFNPLRLLFYSFLHVDRYHLFHNTAPFLILGGLTMLPETRDFWVVTAVTILTVYLGVWRFGKAPGVGASGLILGYFGFIISRGFFAKDSSQVLFAMAVLIFYSWMFRQMSPPISIESRKGHFFGFVGGLIAAWLLSLPYFSG
jgi:membrane associated rhomboid family serine protease